MQILKALRGLFKRDEGQSIKKAVTQDESIRASARRTANHDVRASYRKNTRGLPVGVGPHRLRAAKRIKNMVANDPEAVIGETRLHAAETVLEAVKKNAAFRNRHPRKPKLARRIAALR